MLKTTKPGNRTKTYDFIGWESVDRSISINNTKEFLDYLATQLIFHDGMKIEQSYLVSERKDTPTSFRFLRSCHPDQIRVHSLRGKYSLLRNMSSIERLDMEWNQDITIRIPRGSQKPPCKLHLKTWRHLGEPWRCISDLAHQPEGYSVYFADKVDYIPLMNIIDTVMVKFGSIHFKNVKVDLITDGGEFDWISHLNCVASPESRFICDWSGVVQGKYEFLSKNEIEFVLGDERLTCDGLMEWKGFCEIMWLSKSRISLRLAPLWYCFNIFHPHLTEPRSTKLFKSSHVLKSFGEPAFWRITVDINKIDTYWQDASGWSGREARTDGIVLSADEMGVFYWFHVLGLKELGKQVAAYISDHTDGLVVNSEIDQTSHSVLFSANESFTIRTRFYTVSLVFKTRDIILNGHIIENIIIGTDILSNLRSFHHLTDCQHFFLSRLLMIYIY